MVDFFIFKSSHEGQILHISVSEKEFSIWIFLCALDGVPIFKKMGLMHRVSVVSTSCACRLAEGKQIAVSLNTYIVCVALVMARPSSCCMHLSFLKLLLKFQHR
jgi:hypothetical protein